MQSDVFVKAMECLCKISADILRADLVGRDPEVESEASRKELEIWWNQLSEEEEDQLEYFSECLSVAEHNFLKYLISGEVV